MTLSVEKRLGLYRQMVVIRAFEKKIDFLFGRGLIKGTCHVCVGQEAVPVALCEALRPDDYAVGTHRGHGLAIAKGVPVRGLLAEIMGRAEGICGGRGGSQHSAWEPMHFLGTNGIVCGGLPLASGAAAACKYFKNGRIVAVTLGDGAVNEGVFHETLNIASSWGLPLLIVCENNLYAMSTPVESASAEAELWKRAASYRIEALRADGNDLAGLLDVFRQAVKTVREDVRPVFIECMTYRWLGHSKSDARVYRTREEEAAAREGCPLRRWRRELIAAGVPEADAAAIDRDANQWIEELAEELATSPAAAGETLKNHVYAN